MSRDLKNEALFLAIQKWNLHFSGTTSLDVADKLGISHKKAMKVCLELEQEEKVTVNQDRETYVITLDTETLEQTIDEEPTVCHFIFPTKDVLTAFYYNSDLVRMDIPLYRARQHQGASSYDSAFFHEEVLSRYLNRPELYEVENSLSGGSIKSLVTCDNFVYVRFGKRMMENGQRAVVTLFADLISIVEDEQRYWHGFELRQPVFASTDEHYEKFVDRTFEGAWVDYHDPITNALQSVAQANLKIGGDGLFRYTFNPFLRSPVENTYSVFLSACSELYKVMGADSLNADTLKSILATRFGVAKESFTHKETKRPLSEFQLLKLLEETAGFDGKASGVIEQVKSHRNRSGHAILSPEVATVNYIEKFHKLCDDVGYALMYFAVKVEAALHETNLPTSDNSGV